MRRLLAIAVTILASASPATAGVVGWGHNANGELDVGYRSIYVASPTQSLLPESIQLGAGESHSGVLTAKGEVLVADRFGVRDEPSSGVAELNISSGHNSVLSTSGHISGWGFESFGELGNGVTKIEGFLKGSEAFTIPNLVATRNFVGQDDEAAITPDDRLWVWGEDHSAQLTVKGTEGAVSRPELTAITNAKQVAFGGISSLGGTMYVVKNNGELWAAGLNTHGELAGASSAKFTGQPVHLMDNVQAVSAGATHALALLDSGIVMAWGGNCCGQLGPLAPISESVRPVPVPLPALATEVSAGFAYSLVVAGEAYGFGRDNQGQLGIGYATKNPVSRPTLIGPYHGLVAGEDHALAFSGRTPPSPGPPPKRLPNPRIAFLRSLARKHGCYVRRHRRPHACAVWRKEVRKLT